MKSSFFNGVFLPFLQSTKEAQIILLLCFWDVIIKLSMQLQCQIMLGVRNRLKLKLFEAYTVFCWMVIFPQKNKNNKSTVRLIEMK